MYHNCNNYRNQVKLYRKNKKVRIYVERKELNYIIIIVVSYEN